MTLDGPWRVLVVDDDEAIGSQLKRFFDTVVTESINKSFDVVSLDSFDSALELIEASRFDLIILDLRLGDEGDQDPGEKILLGIKERCFIPIIFYTGWAGRLREYESPLVRVVAKGETDMLMAAIESIFESRLPQINRALTRKLETVQRNYMWEFVAEHWGQLVGAPNQVDLAYLLARRLAIAFSDSGISDLVSEIDDAVTYPADGSGLHPVQLYIVPPLESSPWALAGDIYQGKHDAKFRIMLTPSCDLVHNKAEHVLMALCTPVTDENECQEWKNAFSNNKEDSVKKLIKNTRRGGQAERYHYLPAALSIPDLLVDFQSLEVISGDELASNYDRIASLDSPFAEALLSRFARYLGRIGTPDLNLDLVMARLKDVLRRTNGTAGG